MADHHEVEIQRNQIIAYIKRYIKKNQLLENDKIPSENRLAELFGANRNTVRAALGILKAQGIIYSQKGKGFFVSKKPKPIVFQHDNALGFSEILNKGHRKYTSSVLNVKLLKATKTEQKKLELNEGDEVYHVKQLRTLNGERFAMCMSVIPRKRVPGFDEHLKRFSGTDNIFINVYHFPHPICNWVQLTASLPTAEEVDVLGISENMPILQQENIFHVDGIGNVEYFIVRARGDMFHFTMEFK